MPSLHSQVRFLFGTSRWREASAYARKQNGMTVWCDCEEWALHSGQELMMIDATLKMAGIDTQRLSSRVLVEPREPSQILVGSCTEGLQRSTDAN
ncbi:hypothetical protein F6X42_40855 [Paraburkholderia sp. WC7.3b]|uniref:Uncharacterized protein n=1 Tax=Paraburkholderia podalyriae TaxID=1938811 RepID=A0ABR7Q1W9_9BURK|nr:hypothetical protein [Paraburkholderia podalyriae]